MGNVNELFIKWISSLLFLNKEQHIENIYMLFIYILSLLFLWYIPLNPMVSFTESRAQYEKNYSLQEIEDISLRSYRPGVAILSNSMGMVRGTITLCGMKLS